MIDDDTVSDDMDTEAEDLEFDEEPEPLDLTVGGTKKTSSHTTL